MEKKNEFIGPRGKNFDIVRLNGWDWFYYREDEKELPKIGAWCKSCARETAKPVYPVWMNGKEAYALRCEKCGSEYAMYKSMFIRRYVGYNTADGGHVNPTHGMISHIQAMDRKTREEFIKRKNEIPQKVEDEMCKAFGYTHEQYREMKKEWESNNSKIHKKLEQKEAKRHAEYEEELRQQRSADRKELIEKGILKYVKNIGLVNTETGEVVKL